MPRVRMQVGIDLDVFKDGRFPFAWDCTGAVPPG